MLATLETVEDIVAERLKPRKEGDLHIVGEFFDELTVKMKTKNVYNVDTNEFQLEARLSAAVMDRMVDVIKRRICDITACVNYIDAQSAKCEHLGPLAKRMHDLHQEILNRFKKLLGRPAETEYPMTATNFRRDSNIFALKLTTMRTLLKIAKFELEQPKSHDDSEVNARV